MPASCCQRLFGAGSSCSEASSGKVPIRTGTERSWRCHSGRHSCCSTVSPGRHHQDLHAGGPAWPDVPHHHSHCACALCKWRGVCVLPRRSMAHWQNNLQRVHLWQVQAGLAEARPPCSRRLRQSCISAAHHRLSVNNQLPPFRVSPFFSPFSLPVFLLVIGWKRSGYR